MTYSIPPERAAAIRAEFKRVIESAVPAYEFAQIGMFEDDEERIIQRELDRRLHEAQLPHGGKRELKIIQRLKRMARLKDWEGQGKAWMAAHKWQEIIGWYYGQRPLTPKGNKEEFDWYNGKRIAAKTSLRGESRPAEKQHLRDLVWFAELMLAGMPERVADFRLECKFLLTRYNGEVDRLVRLRNVVNEHTDLISLDAEAFHAPQKFRKWCLSRGNYNWGGNEKDLEKLHIDIGRNSAWRTVQQIVSFGWREMKVKQAGEMKHGLWFFGDTVIADPGPARERKAGDQFVPENVDVDFRLHIRRRLPAVHHQG